MPGMLRALVFQNNIFGSETREFLVNKVGGTHAGNTFLKGFTLTDAYTPA